MKIPFYELKKKTILWIEKNQLKELKKKTLYMLYECEMLEGELNPNMRQWDNNTRTSLTHKIFNRWHQKYSNDKRRKV